MDERFWNEANILKMLCLIFIATLVATTNAQYCGIDYCGICADHPMCNYPSSDFGEGCFPPVFAGLMCNTEKQIILDVHNNLRRRVAKGLETFGRPGPQPPAANMRKLEWDDELASIAQRYTDQCRFTELPCFNVERFNVAANSWDGSFSTPNPEERQNWKNIVEAWYSYVIYFDSNNVSPYVPGDGDFYTLTVWADTYRVGCGFTAFTIVDGLYEYQNLCLYGPGGNIIGDNSSVYLIGSECSACPEGTTCDDGLCV